MATTPLNTICPKTPVQPKDHHTLHHIYILPIASIFTELGLSELSDPYFFTQIQSPLTFFLPIYPSRLCQLLYNSIDQKETIPAKAFSCSKVHAIYVLFQLSITIWGSSYDHQGIISTDEYQIFTSSLNFSSAVFSKCCTTCFAVLIGLLSAVSFALTSKAVTLLFSVNCDAMLDSITIPFSGLLSVSNHCNNLPISITLGSVISVLATPNKSVTNTLPFADGITGFPKVTVHTLNVICSPGLYENDQLLEVTPTDHIFPI
ncbi:TPA: hypothetical protein DIC40_06210 [Patescibacteria group bacterium]|nr:hypothetical protein [Candidatus Gracilibacteria bacterium]